MVAVRELCHHVEVELAQGVAEGTGRLVIVCGLPGSGMTTLAKQLSAGGAAVRMSPDDWMDALGINLWDTAARGRIEALQWHITRDLLGQGISVVIEWGTWRTRAPRPGRSQSNYRSQFVSESPAEQYREADHQGPPSMIS